MALETFQFCIGNKKALLNRTNVFGAYFPPLLKLYAWAPALHQYARIHIILPFHVRCFFLLLLPPMFTAGFHLSLFFSFP